jgi:antitoxin YefM
MFTEIVEKGVVRNGRIDLPLIDLPDGTAVEVFVRSEVEVGEEDATDYLLSTEANRKQMYDTLEELEHPENFVPFNTEEYEKRLSDS